MSEQPLVSGVSPNEGLPGTKVTIRGEHLGSRVEDITSITICGVSCMDGFEYVNSKKLICYTPVVRGSGEIIITTYTGGPGKCTVTFTGLEPERLALLDPLQESDTWMEEDFNTLTRVFSDKKESPVYTRDLTDPLGQAGSSRKVRAGSENMGDLYANASASLTDKNFHPVRHLLEKHRYTNFEDLKLGLGKLKREVERNDQAPIQFMRDNLDAFLQCYDHLSDVNSLLLRDESESQGGTLTDRVEELLRESAERAKQAFNKTLQSKAQADTTRNALTVLQRYRFLFSLPKNIEKNIKTHEYDKVATDYEKAKSLFSNTQVPIFKRVLEEVEKQISKFREDLRLQLLELPVTLDQQKKLIKYLLELDCDGDPAWDCICNMFLWVLRLLYTSKEDLQFLQSERLAGELASLPEYLAPSQPSLPSLPPRTRSMGKEGHSRNISDVSYASTSSYGSQSTVPSSPQPRSPERHGICGAGGVPVLKGLRQGGRLRDTGAPPNRICFVEEVTEILCVTLPDLWKLGQAYLNGKLFQGVALLTENQKKLAKKCDNNRNNFENKVFDTIEIYTNMVHCALFPDAYDSLTATMSQKLGAWNGFDDDTLETSGVWLPQTVRRVRECVGSMEGLGLPEKGVTLLRNLAMNVRSLCSDTLFQRAAKDIKVLHEREDWKVHNEENGIVTSLPVLFENRVVDVLLTLKEIVNETYEEMMAEVHQELKETAKKHFSVLLEHFLASLDCLAFHSDDDAMAGPGVTTAIHEEMPWTVSHARTCKDKHLLILMSNMHYLIEEVIPRIYTCFLSQGYSSTFSLQDEMVEKVIALDDKVFNAYMQRKSDSLHGIIEHGMAVGYFDWEHAGDPTEVRSYVREILMNLVLIHSEVYAVSAILVPRVMHRLVFNLSQEFLECISEVESFNVNGVIHGFVELLALEEILKPYLDDESRSNFELSKKHLGEWDIEGDERVRAIVDRFKTKTRLQLKCFHMQAFGEVETDTRATAEE